MSTTTALETAIHYSGVDKQRGVVLQIDAGRIDVGASIQVLFRSHPFIPTLWQLLIYQVRTWLVSFPGIGPSLTSEQAVFPVSITISV